MKLRLRLREFFRRLYARLFGSFAIRKVIKDADLLLCDSFGNSLLNIRSSKCYTELSYLEDGLFLSIEVYGARFCPHAYRHITTDAHHPIVRDYEGDVRSIGQVHIYDDNKMRVFCFHGLMSEVHQSVGVIAGAPVVTVVDEYMDDFIPPEDYLIDDNAVLSKVEDRIGAVRYIPIMTYSGKGYINS